MFYLYPMPVIRFCIPQQPPTGTNPHHMHIEKPIASPAHITPWPTFLNLLAEAPLRTGPAPDAAAVWTGFATAPLVRPGPLGLVTNVDAVLVEDPELHGTS